MRKLAKIFLADTQSLPCQQDFFVFSIVNPGIFIITYRW